MYLLQCSYYILITTVFWIQLENFTQHISSHRNSPTYNILYNIYDADCGRLACFHVYRSVYATFVAPRTFKHLLNDETIIYTAVRPSLYTQCISLYIITLCTNYLVCLYICVYVCISIMNAYSAAAVYSS